MIGLILAAALLAQQAPAGLSAEARTLVAPVAEAIAAEKARQAALPPPTTDRERLERMGALDQAVRSGKALYVGVSSYSPELTRAAYRILKAQGTPFVIHQPSYSMLNRWVEDGLLDTLAELGLGCIAFSPLAQGLLTTKYLNGVPEGSRATRSVSFSPELITPENIERILALNGIAKARGQSLAQMAIAWVLRNPAVTSALIGARNVEQLDNSLDALNNLQFSGDELRSIDTHATEGGIDLWRSHSSIKPTA